MADIEFPIVIRLTKPLVSRGTSSGVETVIDEVRVPSEPTYGALRKVLRVPAEDRLHKSIELCTDLPPHLIDSLRVADALAIQEAIAPFFTETDA